MVIIVIVCIDIVIDHGGHKAHVAESVRPARHPVTPQVLAFLGFLLELVNSLGGNIIRSFHPLTMIIMTIELTHMII